MTDAHIIHHDMDTLMDQMDPNGYIDVIFTLHLPTYQVVDVNVGHQIQRHIK